MIDLVVILRSVGDSRRKFACVTSRGGNNGRVAASSGNLSTMERDEGTRRRTVRSNRWLAIAAGVHSMRRRDFLAATAALAVTPAARLAWSAGSSSTPSFPRLG